MTEQRKEEPKRSPVRRRTATMGRMALFPRLLGERETVKVRRTFWINGDPPPG